MVLRRLGRLDRNDTVDDEESTERPHDIDDSHTSGAALDALAAGDAEPHIFRFEGDDTVF